MDNNARISPDKPNALIYESYLYSGCEEGKGWGRARVIRKKFPPLFLTDGRTLNAKQRYISALRVSLGKSSGLIINIEACFYYERKISVRYSHFLGIDPLYWY